MTEPFTLQLHITDACQLQCRHCYRDEAKRDLPLADLRGIVEQFREFCASRQVPGRLTIAGGEPLIRREDLLALTLAAVDIPRFAELFEAVAREHELEHVRQMMWFVSEEAFACAYGAGLAMAGGYGQNPFESDAYRLECHEQARILAWLGNPPNALSTPYGNPCDRISRHDPCSKSFW